MIPVMMLALMFAGSTQATSTYTGTDIEVCDANDGYVYIHLQNKCSHDVKYEVKYSGHGSSGSIYKNSKKRLTVQAGAKIYIDGDLTMTVEEGDDGETFTICKIGPQLPSIA